VIRNLVEVVNQSTTLVEVVKIRAAHTPNHPTYTIIHDGNSEETTLTPGELHQRAQAVAGYLQARLHPGERVLLLYPPGLGYITAFFGCLYAGVIAVPVYPPRLNRREARIEAILADCKPVAVLTTASILAGLKDRRAHLPGLEALQWLNTDEIQSSYAELWQEPQPDPHAIAFLQYTSGSTRTPLGVMVSHANLLHNLALISACCRNTPDDRAVSWLPPYHDMGLIGAILYPLYAGFPVTLMPPLAFLQNPYFWLEAISRLKATSSGGPNFAYELCIQKITPDQRAGLDLSSWEFALSGAEPVRVETVERFCAAFGPCGFRKEAFYPSYGLAEATLMVSGGERFRGLKSFVLEDEALKHGQAVRPAASESGGLSVVSCGRSRLGQEIAIVEPGSRRRLPDDHVGEIWIAGPCVAQGYWNHPVQTQDTFQAAIADSGEGPFLRTGDLGFLEDGELYLTGRLKDLLILRGQNHYPQDIEWTVQNSHPALGGGSGAVFSIDFETEERLVVVHEIGRSYRHGDHSTIFDAIRQAVVEHHDLAIQAIVLIQPGSLPRTSSGKVQRYACKELFLSNGLKLVEAWEAGGEPKPLTMADRAESMAKIIEKPHLPHEIQAWLVRRTAEILGIEPSQVDVQQPFTRYGLDSAAVVGIAGELESWLEIQLSPALVYEYPTIAALSDQLANLCGIAKQGPPPDEAQADQTSTHADIGQVGEAVEQSPGGSSAQKRLLLAQKLQAKGLAGGTASSDLVAIVGMSCRFPGAKDAASFWELLRDGTDAIREVPAERWNVDDVYDPDPAVPGKMTTRWGGFLDNVDQFDAQFFGISPREAISMDPQQRLLLEVSWEALENAGQVPDRLVGSRTGVFIGISNEDYTSLRPPNDPTGIDPYTGTGVAFSVAAGRISFILGFQGPNLAVDTACSSSLVSLHLACQSLQAGECELALAGGVNLILSPRVTIYFSKVRAMAPDGRCKTFDARADGYVRGEGCGILVLKRLSDAQRDGDNILAVIRGSAVNHDGRSSGLTVPNGLAQKAVIRAALEKAGIEPRLVSYVETHGTGTPLGDPIEVRALSAVLGKERPKSSPLILGSVKTNIGHLESAAGIAGLIKVVLSLQHGEIPPHLHFQELNPQISLEDLPGVIPSSLMSWPAVDDRRIAGVSSFGISGTNAHVILEEYRPVEQQRPAGTGSEARKAYLVPLSARRPEALRALAGAYRDFLSGERVEELTLPNLAYSTSLRRSQHDHRLACVARSTGELAECLSAYVDGETRPSVSSGRRLPGQMHKLVFVFPGQGSQWPGMGRQLLDEEPVFRAAIDDCERAFRPYIRWSLHDVLETEMGAPQLEEIDVVQPVLFAMQAGLAAMWRSWGIEPDAVVGQSMGEVAAAYVAGALSLEDAARVICLRSRLLKRVSGGGAMAAVELSLEQARRALSGYEDRVSIAVSSSPVSTVLSGERAALEEIISELERGEIFCRWIKVDVASHSPQMDSLRPDLLEILAELQPRRPRLPFHSTVSGRLDPGLELDAEYWVRNLREPVLFSAAVQQLLASGHDLFVEISPHPVLLPWIEQSIRHSGGVGVALPSTRRGEAERENLLSTLGALYCQGVAVDWGKLYPQRGRFVNLPVYPWQHERFWLENTWMFYDQGLQRAARRDGRTGHPLLGEHWTSSTQAGTHFWETDLGPDHLSYLKDHRIEEMIILPAAAYVEMALAAAEEALGTGPYQLEELAFKKALWLPAEGSRRVQLVLTADGRGGASFHFSSLEPGQSDDAGSWTLNAAGLVRVVPEPGESARLPEISAQTVGEPDLWAQDELSSEAHYAAMSERGLRYGPAFRGVRQIYKREGEALSRVGLAKELAHSASRYQVHPALLDAGLQTLAACLPESDLRSVENGVYLPVGIGAVRIYHEPTPDGWSYARLRPARQAGGGFEGDVYLLDEAGNVCLEAQGILVQPLGKNLPAALVEDPASWFYELVWQPSARPVEPADLPAGRWLVFADAGEGLATQLEGFLKEHGRTSVRATPGEEYASGPESYRLNPASPQDFRLLLQDALANGITCAGVVYLWGLQPEPQEGYSPAGLQAFHDLSCGGLLHLVQALVQAGWSSPPRLWLVTRGAQPVQEGECPAIHQAPLWGLSRVIALEHPELNCKRIDCGRASSEEGTRQLLEELLAGDREDQVALRGSERYVARLVARPELPPRSEPPADHSQEHGEKEYLPFRLEIDHPGVLDRLALRAVPRLEPGPGEIEVEVVAAGLNFSDVMKAMGVYPGIPEGGVPLGGEFAGRVATVGLGVEGFRAGDEVMGLAPFSFGAYVLAPAAYVVHKPARFSFEEAATIPVSFLTAYYALVYLGRLAAGEKVLIHSASGGVGQAAIQLARRAGAEIFATAGSPQKREYLQSLGIRCVMDSRSLAFAGQVLEWTQDRGVDVVLNSLAGEAIPRGLSILAPFGRFLEIGKRDIYQNSPLGLLPFQKNLSFFAIDLERLAGERPALLLSLFRQLASAFEDGSLQPLPYQVFPISRASEAFRTMAQARHTGKIVLSMKDEPAILSSPSLIKASFSPQASYLITGGLGALGLATAGWMMERGARHLVLAGRTGLEERPDVAAAVEALRAAGAQVSVYQANISDQDQAASLIAKIDETLPPLRGVIHAAGVLEDGILLQQDWERFKIVMAPKVQGAWNLHSQTLHEGLDFFVLFSSGVSVVGSPGQGNYAAANAFLDALAHYRRAQGLPALSINWGPWSRVGLAAQPGRGGRLAAQGFPSLAPSQGLEALERLMSSGAVQVSVLRISGRSWLQHYPQAAEIPLLADLLSDAERAQTGQPHTSAVRAALLEAEPGWQRRALLEEHLKEQAAQVLRLAADQVDPLAPLQSMGFDSLMALELRNRLEDSLGVPLSATLAWNYPTIHELAGHLADKIGVPLDGEPQPPDTPASPEQLTEVDDELARILDQANDLSTDELRRILAEK
jgi:acyl transferase domain-containing protein/acyl-CoA synthetase (AMP-forming)/AMP-acid ligase II/acyl carrier protein